MTVPLPNGKADELISHMATCPQCRVSKAFPSEQKCPRGQELLRATLTERHGDGSAER